MSKLRDAKRLIGQWKKSSPGMLGRATYRDFRTMLDDASSRGYASVSADRAKQAEQRAANNRRRMERKAKKERA